MATVREHADAGPHDGESPKRNTKSGSGAAQAAARDRDMGSALRSVYQHTVNEAVPDEMLDLLGKLD